MSDCANSKCEPYAASLNGSQMTETSIALSLIRAHYDGDEETFKQRSYDFAKLCDEQGKYQLAEYIFAQVNPACAFVPM